MQRKRDADVAVRKIKCVLQRCRFDRGAQLMIGGGKGLSFISLQVLLLTQELNKFEAVNRSAGAVWLDPVLLCFDVYVNAVMTSTDIYGTSFPCRYRQKFVGAGNAYTPARTDFVGDATRRLMKRPI